MTESERDERHRRPWHTNLPEVRDNIPPPVAAPGITPEMMRLACGIHSTTDGTLVGGWSEADEATWREAGPEDPR